MKRSLKVTQDELYNLLPAIYRQRDAEQGYPLRALIQIIGEQVHLVEADIEQLYDNWFIETCEDWVVPYIGELVGYQLDHQADDGANLSPAGPVEDNLLVPRREVANAIRNRRRKGTLSLLKDLARDAAGWPALVLEQFGTPQSPYKLDELEKTGRQITLATDPVWRSDDPADPTDRIDIGVYLFRLRPYSVTTTFTYYSEEVGGYSFSALGNDTTLYVKSEVGPHHLNGNIPTPLPPKPPLPVLNKGDEPSDQQAEDELTYREYLDRYYGEGKSFAIWEIAKPNAEPELVPWTKIELLDLGNWKKPNRGKVGVDPHCGRITYPVRQRPYRLKVSYYYPFPADIGGGEYRRPLSQPYYYTLYRVVEGLADPERGRFNTLGEALAQWDQEKPANAVIQIEFSDIFAEELGTIQILSYQTLQIRAASGARPIIRLIDRLSSGSDALRFEGQAGGCLILDGLIVTGRPVEVVGPLDTLSIRHCTLVPGWALNPDCTPKTRNRVKYYSLQS